MGGRTAFAVFEFGKADFGFDRAVLNDLQVFNRDAGSQVEADFECERAAVCQA